MPLETRGAIGRYDAARDILEMYGAAKVPHWNRDQLARMLGRDPSSMHLHEGHVGGGFGIRGELYPEDVLVCAAALRLRPSGEMDRGPARASDRRQSFAPAAPSHPRRHRRATATSSRIDDEFFHDQGAYVRTHGGTVPDLAAAMLPGPYRIPAYRVAGHIRLTNKTPAGTYRAPGRFESTFVRERLMDAIAAKAGLSPLEVRRRNFIAAAEMPYDRQLETLGTDVVFDSGDYAGLLDKTLAAHRLAGAAERDRGAPRRRANWSAPVSAFSSRRAGLGRSTACRSRSMSTGAVEVVTGAASVGQGVETVIAQICAETLGVDYERVRVVHGQTDRIDYGLGAFASRATVMTGEATRLAALKVREKAIAMAAELLQSAPEDLDIVDGEVSKARQSSGPSITLAEIARHLLPSSRTRGDREPGFPAKAGSSPTT